MLDEMELHHPGIRSKLTIVGIVLLVVVIAGALVLVGGVLSDKPVHPVSNGTLSRAELAQQTTSIGAGCTTSAQCSAGAYCSNFGQCMTDYCGDGICSTQKQQSGACPIDCGCARGQVLNSYANQCNSPVSISTGMITTYVNNYLTSNNIQGHISSINDSYYGNYTVKTVTVDCATDSSSLPCSIIFFFNQNGKVVAIDRTS